MENEITINQDDGKIVVIIDHLTLYKRLAIALRLIFCLKPLVILPNYKINNKNKLLEHKR